MSDIEPTEIHEPEPEPEPEPSLQLRGVSGEDVGQVKPVDPVAGVEINGRFSVTFESSHLTVRSLTDKDLLINGERAAVSLLDSGDTIQTERSSWIVEPVPVAAGGVGRRMNWVKVAIVIVALLLVATLFVDDDGFIKDFAQRHGVVQLAEKVEDDIRRDLVEPQRKAAPPAGTDKDHVKASPPPPLDQQEIDRRIGEARLRFEMGQAYFREARVEPGYYFWAIQEWQGALHLLAPLETQPALAATLHARIVMAQRTLATQKRQIHLDAVIANRLGYTQDEKLLLQRLVSLTQNPHDPAFIYAEQRLAQLQSGRPSR